MVVLSGEGIVLLLQWRGNSSLTGKTGWRQYPHPNTSLDSMVSATTSLNTWLLQCNLAVKLGGSVIADILSARLWVGLTEDITRPGALLGMARANERAGAIIR